MSYASTGLGQVGAVRVGAAARHDVVLAKASLIASKILLQATKKPLAIRSRFVANKLDAMRHGLARQVAVERRRLVASGKSEDQAIFDAMRLAIANISMDEGIQDLREKASRGYFGAESFAGLGQMSTNDRATGCAIASTAGTVGGIANIVPVYGQIVGAIVGIGSGVASMAMDCSRETREAAAAAAQAQANLAAAQQAAAAQAAAAQGSSRTRLYLIGGGAIIAVLGVGYLLLS